MAREINKISRSGFPNPGRINPGIYGVDAGRVAWVQRRLFALGNPDQAVAGDDRPFGRLGDVAKGNQLCQMMRRDDRGGRGDRHFDQGSELFGRQKLRRVHCHRRTHDQDVALSDWQGHSEIYEPIPDRKRELSVVLRIIAVPRFKSNRSDCGFGNHDMILLTRPIGGGHDAGFRETACLAACGAYFSDRG